MKAQEAVKTDKQRNGTRRDEGRRRPKETNPDWALQQGLVGERGRVKGTTWSPCDRRSVN